MIPNFHLSGLLMASSILNAPHMLIVIIQKLNLTVGIFPILMKVLHLILLNIIVVIGLLHITSFLFLHNLMSLIVQHSLFGNSIHPITVLVGLLFLRYGFAVFVFSR